MVHSVIHLSVGRVCRSLLRLHLNRNPSLSAVPLAGKQLRRLSLRFLTSASVLSVLSSLFLILRQATFKSRKLLLILRLMLFEIYSPFAVILYSGWPGFSNTIQGKRTWALWWSGTGKSRCPVNYRRLICFEPFVNHWQKSNTVAHRTRFLFQFEFVRNAVCCCEYSSSRAHSVALTINALVQTEGWICDTPVYRLVLGQCSIKTDMYMDSLFALVHPVVI